MNSKKIYIFGYGSLVNITNVSNTILENEDSITLIPVWLKGYIRTWNIGIPAYDSKSNKLIAVFLNISKNPTSQVNGVVFEVSESQFEHLKKREKTYNYIDVTENITKYNRESRFQNAKIYTFISKDEYLVKNSKHSVFEKYLRIINTGCEKIGKKFQSDFFKSTSENIHKIVKGDYKFADTEQEDYH